MDKLEDYMKQCTTYCCVKCAWNSGTGYYNVCHHPMKKNRPLYGGIDRYYTEGCDLREEKKDD